MLDGPPLVYREADGWKRTGRVCAVARNSLTVELPGLRPGAAVFVESGVASPLVAEAIACDGPTAICTCAGQRSVIAVGARATSDGACVGAYVGDELLGHVCDAWGRVADGRSRGRPVDLDPPGTAIETRSRVEKLLPTGVGAIDALLSLGRGQRIALLAGPGVGKTSLLRRIVSGATVDARVIGLVGERGREAAESIAKLRATAQARTTTMVVATADATAWERLTAARTATAQAEALAAEGRDVLLVIDSLTRAANAWREVALAAGEVPAHRGHPPSLAGVLGRLVERAGVRRTGSVTAVYAVLVDGDDPREPVSDLIRGFVDGHIVLARNIADAGRFPAIDILRSVSRLMDDVATHDHRRDARTVRHALASLEHADDLIAVGAYRAGNDTRLDAALSQRSAIEALVHDADDADRLPDPIATLASIAARLRAGS
ncbi:MAG TPA: hypothetical protein VEJ20_03215 [Candidatus Eremiobacteraceae bacterium]|nr:hypothetical protein [Candidatus Eremiobacteraceae bacterium]